MNQIYFLNSTLVLVNKTRLIADETFKIDLIEPTTLFLFFIYLIFVARSCYVAQADLELKIHPPQPLQLNLHLHKYQTVVIFKRF